MKRRKAAWSQEIKLRSEVYKNELKKASNLAEELEDCKQRKVLFLDDAPFEEHEFLSEEEANTKINEIQTALDKQIKRNERLFENRQKIITMRSQPEGLIKIVY